MLGIITMFRDEAPYLVEWIEYHQLVGVQKFLLYDNNSADNWREVLASYRKQGLIEVFSWPSVDGDITVRRLRQMDAFRDGLRRMRGQVPWAALIDVDEFLVPMRDADVTSCLQRRRFSGAAGVYVNWRMFGTSGETVPRGEPLLTKLTACSLADHPENSTGKSLVRPETVAVEEAWYPHHFPLRTGAKYVDGRGHACTFERRILNGHARYDLVKEEGHFDNFLRINHYNLRDESFYRRSRLPAATAGTLNKSMELLREHYDSFGRTRDDRIVAFLKKHHSAMFHKFWST